MVVFKQVEVNNFLAIKEAILELDNRGLILIEGENKSNESFHSNGSGKSTLISAITYALYGKTEKGLKADDVVNNIEKKNTSVKLKFDIGEDSYLIERYRKDKENKNKVKLFVNDNEITGSTNDVTDKQIQDLFGIEFNTYVNAIMYGQGDIPMFSQATDKGKKEILESITKTDVYKQAQDIAKEKVKEVEEQQNNLRQEIDKLGYQLSTKDEYFQKEIEQYNQYKEQLAQIENSNKEKDRLREQEEKQIEAQIGQLTSQVPTIPDEQFKHSEDYNKASQSLDLLSNKLTELNQVYTDYNTKEQVLKSEIATLNNSLNQLDTNDHCPVCGSLIDNSHKLKEQENINNQIESKKQEVTSVLGMKDTYKEAIDKVNNKAQEIKDKMTQEDQQEREHNNKINSLIQEVSKIKSDISSLENNKTYLKVKYQHQSVQGLEREEPSKEKHEEDKKELQNAIDKHEENVVQLESKKGKYQQAVDAFSNKGIRSVVLDFITPFLNEKANEYLQTLSGSDIEIEFQTQVKNAKGELKDKFDVIVKNSKGGGSYKSNSAGEQKRIDLAISFAIQDLIMSKDEISTNIALYDECFDGLDTVGCENVIKLLKDRLNTVGTIFVITHNTELKPLFEQTIKIVKENGISKLEEK